MFFFLIGESEFRKRVTPINCIRSKVFRLDYIIHNIILCTRNHLENNAKNKNINDETLTAKIKINLISNVRNG